MSRTLPPPVGNPPTKVIFDGVEPGSQQARALFFALQGEIEHFHAKARQQRDLSQLPGSGMVQALPNGDRLSYSYNNGLEVIHIRLSTKETSQEVEPEVPTASRWDYALVEITIPGLPAKLSADFSAFVQGEYSTAWDNAGLYSGPMEFCTGVDVPDLGEVFNSDWVASLKIDLRGMTKLTKVDLYGYVYPDEGPSDTPDGTILRGQVGRKWLNYPNTPSELGEKILIGDDSVVAEFPELAALPRWTDQYVLLSMIGQINNFRSTHDGSIVWDGGTTHAITTGWPNNGISYGATLNDVLDAYDGPYTEARTYSSEGYLRTETFTGSHWFKIGTGTGYLPPPGPDDVVGSFYFQGACVENYYVYNYPTVPVYTPRAAEITTTLFHGAPIDAKSDITVRTGEVGFRSKSRWELSSSYPRTFRSRVLANLEIPSIDPPVDIGPDEHYGMVLLGTVEIDPIYGTTKWKPA